MPGRDSSRRHHGRLLGPSLKDDVRWLEGRCLSPSTLLSPRLPSHATFTTLSYASIHLLMISWRWNQTALMEHVLFPLAFFHVMMSLCNISWTQSRREAVCCDAGVPVVCFCLHILILIAVCECPSLAAWGSQSIWALGSESLQRATAGFSSIAAVALMQTPLRCLSS